VLALTIVSPVLLPTTIAPAAIDVPALVLASTIDVSAKSGNKHQRHFHLAFGTDDRTIFMYQLTHFTCTLFETGACFFKPLG
jgi:hypothetical protein